EQHAGVALEVLAVGRVRRAGSHAEDVDVAVVGRAQADDRAHQHRLAAARAADHPEDLALAHVDVEAVVHHLGTEAVDQAAHADDGFGAAHQPTCMNQIAAIASRMITSENVCTTLEVVRSPSDCAVPCTCSPSRQPIRPITSANTGALDMPTKKCRSSTVSCRRAAKACGVMPISKAATAMPPRMPEIMAMKVSS